jgi:CheY-like chemotaxis protein
MPTQLLLEAVPVERPGEFLPSRPLRVLAGPVHRANVEARRSRLLSIAVTNRRRANVRVAIADDDPLARSVIEAMIAQSAKLALVGSANGVDEIVDLSAYKRPDVVVLDWMMPGGGGPEAARQILASRPSTRIVALTSCDSSDAWVEMTCAGATCFLVKGCSREQLTRALATP